MVVQAYFQPFNGPLLTYQNIPKNTFLLSSPFPFSPSTPTLLRPPGLDPLSPPPKPTCPSPFSTQPQPLNQHNQAPIPFMRKHNNSILSTTLLATLMLEHHRNRLYELTITSVVKLAKMKSKIIASPHFFFSLTLSRVE